MFAHPTWLLLLIAPPLLALVAWLVSRSNRRRWSAFVAERLRASLIKGDSALLRWLSLLSLLVATSLLIIALARPYAISGTEAETIRSRNILIALDLSRSMRVADVKPDRLSQAKIIAYELMDAMPNERIGIIGFAGQAYLCAPLTIDHRAVRETVGQLDESWVPLGGSNLSEAINLAVKTLRETGQKNNALIVLSDGEKHEKSLDDAITNANQANMFIITIGVGTEDGDYVPNPDFPSNRMVDENGKPIISRLKADALEALASETGGRFAVAGSGTDLAALVKNAVKDLDTFEAKGRQRVVKTEFYQWFTVPAVLFFLFSIITGTRWRKLTPHLATALCLMASLGNAPAATPTDALRALRKGKFDQAAKLYGQLAGSSRSDRRRAGFHLGQATAYYETHAYRDARAAYSKALLSPDSATIRQAHFGLGNTLFQAGWSQLSKNPHPDDAQSAPSMEDFDRIVRKFLRGGLASNDDDSLLPYRRTRNLVRDWTDAVRHYETVLSVTPDHTAAAANRDLTIHYLKRLQELLKEERDKMQQSMGPPGGEGGEEPNPDQQGDESGDEGEDGSQGNQGEKQNQGDDGTEPRDRNGNQAPEKQKPKEQGDNGEKSGEQESDQTPEDRARRILRENADNERGPLRPGQIEFLSPEKDW